MHVPRLRFWQFGGPAFIGGFVVGAIAGPSIFPFALTATILIVSGGALAFAVVIRAARLTGDEAERSVYEKGVRYAAWAAGTIVAFAGYCLSGLLLRGGSPNF